MEHGSFLTAWGWWGGLNHGLVCLIWETIGGAVPQSFQCDYLGEWGHEDEKIWSQRYPWWWSFPHFLPVLVCWCSTLWSASFYPSCWGWSTVRYLHRFNFTELDGVRFEFSPFVFLHVAPFLQDDQLCNHEKILMIFNNVSEMIMLLTRFINDSSVCG